MNDNQAPTRDDVIKCYKFLLGREPESEEAIEWHINASSTVEQLISHFIRGDEFESRFGIFRTGMYFDADKVDVEVEATPEQLAKLLDRTAVTWSELGYNEPHWSVITDPAFTRGNIAENLDTFYRTGQAEIERIGALLRRNGFEFDPGATCLDFGCGVGRLSLALADKVAHVNGVDISEGHIRAARYASKERFAKSNLSFIQINTVDDIDSLPTCDLLVTLIVLQHNPPPVMYAILQRLLRRLKPGGVAVFQVPVYRDNYKFSVSAYLTSIRKLDMEMHPLPPRYVFKAIAEAGCSVLEVREDLHAYMRDIVSQTFLVQKST